jgi:hypothetical protein
MMKKMMLLLTAALGLTMSAHARLGWTLDDCQNMWGAPVRVTYDSSINQTFYIFRAQPNLFTQVCLLNGYVQSIGYFSKDKTLLKNNADQLLQKNYPGAWTRYDDGRRQSDPLLVGGQK